MERVINPDDRIRRAEEIYARRQNLRERTKKATLNVSAEPTKGAKIVKKVGLQIIICVMIYYIFHLISTTNYTFSADALKKLDELISFDYDFYGLYNTSCQYVQGWIAKLQEENNEQEQNSEEQSQNTENQSEENDETKEDVLENQKSEENQIGAITENKVVQIAENVDESLTQSELPEANINETDRIKSKYSFLCPLAGRISSEYGTREVTSAVVTAYHKGIDIAANIGTTIVSATSGEVIIAKYSPSYR